MALLPQYGTAEDAIHFFGGLEPPNTYVVVDSFDSEAEAQNLYAYLKTKFARFLIYVAMGGIMVTKGTFKFLPVQDFSKEWTDKTLYSKYGLSDQDISYIESLIKEM